ncbi:alpha-isopropylmalate synthase regulatory domain-containing protein, partial [Thioclava electrotropha]|uniref:alpha-isopropylmalate synthase regulatory domain-containing protein n=1 Tax=Thioclava electrotropha TaxID=1549850 RepID=UPI0023A8876F
DWLDLQRRLSEMPQAGRLLIESFPHDGREHVCIYGFAGRNAMQTLGLLVTKRMEETGLAPLGFVATDYATLIWGLEPLADPQSLFAPESLRDITKLSRKLDDILNRVPLRSAPYVGASAFTHKAGLHASAILKNPDTYEHIDPAVVGNTRLIPMSNQAGQSNLRARLKGMGIEVAKDDPRLARILDLIKEREDQGYAYDGAQASFELLARAELGQLPKFFEVKRYKVTVERRKNRYDKMVSISEAVVVVKVGGKKMLSVSESMDEQGHDRGPVNALSKALSKDLGPYQSLIDDMKLVDFRVRITQGGTEAVTRVIIDSEDDAGQRWSTVGVSPNIVDASFEALLDAMIWKLMRDGAKPA